MDKTRLLIVNNWLPVFALVLFVSIGVTGCKTHEKLVYMQPKITTDSIPNQTYSPVYKVNDLVAVSVSGSDQESVKPFNLTVVAFSQGDGRVSGTPVQQGYFVDLAGEIAMPVIGKVKIAGLTREGAVAAIQEKLLPYVKDPLVAIRLMNFKVTVLGEVKVPGVVEVSNERITLLEALGAAGDLLITGERKNVLIIRERNGKKIELRVDLTSNELLKHPAYYLEQNDVVYVEPNKTKRNSSMVGPGASVVIALASLVITTISILTR